MGWDRLLGTGVATGQKIYVSVLGFSRNAVSTTDSVVLESESGQFLESSLGHAFTSHCQQAEENSLELKYGKQTSLHHVQQVLFICQRIDQTYAFSFWREAAHLC